MNVDAENETASVLGITAPRGKTRSALWISHAVTDGLPLTALERLVQQVAPDNRNFVYLIVSKPTLARRKKALHEWTAKHASEKAVDRAHHHDTPISVTQRNYAKARSKRDASSGRAQEAVLSPAEGAKVARLAEVWAMARKVWGSDEEARAFLFQPHPMLENLRPIDVVLADEFGRPLVEQILGRLQYGSAA
jgi:putative toxin-antitoxin system antitoxin component (TIGR02293 family)